MPTVNAFGELVEDSTSNAFDLLYTPTSPSPAENKQARLQQRIAEKADKFKTVTLDRMPDADTYGLRGLEGNVRSDTFNAYETSHGPDWAASEYAQRVMPQQRAQLALELGVSPETVTDDMVYQKGTQQALESLAAATGSPDWKAGPVDIDPANHPQLGSAEYPMGIDVQANLNLNANPTDQSSTNNYGRHLGTIQGMPQNRLSNASNGTTDIDAAFAKVMGTADSSPLRQEEGFLAEAISLPGAAAHGAVKGIGNLVDFGGELVQRGTNAVFGTDFKGGTFEDGTVDDFANSLGMALGYDHRDDAEVNQKAQVFYDSGFEGVDILDPSSYGNIKVLDVLKGMGTQLTNPSSAASSLGEIFGTGGVGKGTQIIGKAGIKALRGKAAKEAAESAEDVFKQIAITKADNTLSKADKASKLNSLNSQVSAIQVASHKMQDAIPAIAYSMDITNQHMADYRKNNNGEEMSNGRMMGTLLANTLAFALPEIATTKIALGMNKAVNAELKEKLNGGVKEAVGKLALGGIVEFPQELTEGIVESINTKWGTKAYEGKTMAEIVSSETADILGQAFGGAVGGVHMATPGAAKGLISDTADNTGLRGALNEKIESIKSTPTEVADAVKAAPDTAVATPIFSALSGKSFEEARPIMQEQMKAIKEEAAEAGVDSKEILSRKPQEFREDFNKAVSYYKELAVKETTKSGKLSDQLNATPEEEHYIINAFVNTPADKEEAFIAELRSRGTDDNHPDETPEYIEGLIETAKTQKALYNELSQLDKTRQSVARDGVSKDKKGFITYYQDAISSPVGSAKRLDNTQRLSAFTASQIAKKDKLEAARESATAPTIDAINSIANATGRSTADVWTAMTYASGISNKLQDAKFKEAFDSFSPEYQAKMNRDTGIEVYEYASEYYNHLNDAFNRSEGTFEINGKTTLLDAAEDVGGDIESLGKTWSTGSGVSKTIKHTEREIQAMTKALKLLEKNSLRKTAPESQKGTQKPQTIVTDTTTPVEETKAPEAPRTANIAKASGTQLAAWRTIASQRRKDLAEDVANGIKTVDEAAEAESKINAFDMKVEAEQAKRDSVVPKEETPIVTEESTPTTELKVDVTPEEMGYTRYTIGEDETSEVRFRDHEDGTGTIETLDVDLSDRRQGHSTAMLTKVIEEHGNKELNLSAEPKPGIDMTNLVKLYESFGFVVDGEVGKKATAMVRPANTSPEAQKPTKEATKADEGKSTQEEVKEEPEAPEDVVSAPLLGSKELADKVTVLTDKILKASANDNTELASYKNNIDEVIALLDHNVGITDAKLDDIRKALIKDKIYADKLSRVQKVLKHLATGKPLTNKHHRNTVNKLIPEILAEQASRVSTYNHIKGKPNEHIERIKETSEDNTPISAKVGEVESKRESLTKTRKPTEETQLRNLTDEDIAFLDEGYIERSADEYTKMLQELDGDTIDVVEDVIEEVQEEVVPVTPLKNLTIPKGIKEEYVQKFLELDPLKMTMAELLKNVNRSFSLKKEDSANIIYIKDAISIMQDNMRTRIANDINMHDLTEAQRVALQEKLEYLTTKKNANKDRIKEVLDGSAVGEYINSLKELQNTSKDKEGKKAASDKLTYLFGLFKLDKELTSRVLEIRNKQNTSKATFKELVRVHGSKVMTSSAKKFDDTADTYKSSANALGIHLTVKKATSILSDKETITMEDLRTVFTNPKKQIADFRHTSGVDTVGNSSLFSYPHLMLLRKGNKDQPTNLHTVIATKIAVEKYIADNYNTLMKLAPRNLASFYGVKEENWATLPKELIESGIPSTYMVDSISKDIGDMLGLKAVIVKDDDGKVIEDNSDYLDKVLNGLALTGIRNAWLSEGRLERHVVTQKDGSKLNTYKLKLADTASSDGIYVKGNNAKSEHALYVKTLTDRFDINKEERTRIHTTPSTRESGSIAKKRDSMVTVSPTTAKAVHAYEAEVWSTNNPALDLIENTLERKDGFGNMLNLLGFVDVDNDTAPMLYETKVSIQGKNSQIENDLSNIQELLRKRKEGETASGIFFRWFVASNGRPMIDAKGGLDPQGIKLHRYLVNNSGQHGSVDTDTDVWSETMFKLGFAQGLGFSIDKRDIEESIEFADALLTKDNLAVLHEAFINGESSPSVVVEINGKDEVVKFKEPGHSALAITEGIKFVEANGSPFYTTMTLEIDGLTNGFGHKMMNFLATDDAYAHVITPAAVEWLRKIGFEFKSQEQVLDIVQQIQIGKADKTDTRGIVDAYLTLADDIAPDLKGDELLDAVVGKVVGKFDKLASEATAKEMKEINKDLVSRFGTSDRDEIQKRIRALLVIMPSLRDEDGELSGFVRDLMKDPFMTFGYGAGAAAMSNSVAAALIEDAFVYVLKADKNDSNANAFIASLGISNRSREALNKELQTKPFNAIFNDHNVSLLDAFRGLVKGVYGDSIDAVMSANFEGMQTINKSMLTTANAIFDIFEMAYNTELTRRGIAIGTVPTQAIHEEILSELSEAGMLPVIMTPDSSSYDDGMAMYKTESAPAAKNEFGTAAVPKVGDQPSEAVSSRKRKLVNPGAGPIALLTHHWDAFGTSLQGSKRSILQVFDAYVLGVNQHEVVEEINKDFVETTLLHDMSQISTMKDGLIRIIANAKRNYGVEYKAFKANVSKESKHPDNVLQSITEIDDAAVARNTQAREQKVFTAQQFAMNKSAGYTYTNDNGVEDIDTRKESTTNPKAKVVNKAKTTKQDSVGNTYEVSTKGDKRYSALVAKLPDGRTIEEAYQLDVKGYRSDSNDWRAGKGKPPKDTSLNLQREYAKLWMQYFTANPNAYAEISNVVNSGKTLIDSFATKDSVNQATTIEKLVKSGWKPKPLKQQVTDTQSTISDESFNKVGIAPAISEVLSKGVKTFDDLPATSGIGNEGSNVDSGTITDNNQPMANTEGRVELDPNNCN